MLNSQRPQPEEVDVLLRNAELRDQLEPYLDESIHCVNVHELPTPLENEFLESMLAWERAPVLPVCQWFEPALEIPRPDSLSDAELHEVMWDTINKLFDKRVVLDFTDHLSDRELYTLLYRDILPSPEKRIETQDNYLHWDCAGMGDDADTWLRYYASEADRRNWAEEFDVDVPPAELPPHPRMLPRRPL